MAHQRGGFCWCSCSFSRCSLPSCPLVLQDIYANLSFPIILFANVDNTCYIICINSTYLMNFWRHLQHINLLFSFREENKIYNGQWGQMNQEYSREDVRGNFLVDSLLLFLMYIFLKRIVNLRSYAMKQAFFISKQIEVSRRPINVLFV